MAKKATVKSESAKIKMGRWMDCNGRICKLSAKVSVFDSHDFESRDDVVRFISQTPELISSNRELAGKSDTGDALKVEQKLFGSTVIDIFPTIRSIRSAQMDQEAAELAKKEELAKNNAGTAQPAVATVNS